MAVVPDTRDYRGKRLLDLVLTVSTAPLWLAVGIACAVAVKLDSKGPVLFKQQRAGRGGQPFIVFKFRTMVADQGENPVLPDDRRVTRVGARLRRWSLDELPQILNVLRGEMSLVGPRPTLVYQVERYDSRQQGRLSVRPGLTGLAQLNGRNAIPWGRRIEMDLEYVQQQSLLLDLALLAKTPIAIFNGRGVSGHPADDPIANPSSNAGE